MKTFVRLTCLVLVFAFGSVADAATIIDPYGDRDGFGIHVGVDQPFDWRDLESQPTGHEGLTDFFTSQNYPYLQWTHTYSTSGIGTITAATLEIFSGGQGAYGPTEVYLDGQLVGTLSDGEIDGVLYARVDTLDLMPYVHLLDGNDTVLVNSFPGGKLDTWVLDYSEIKITHTPISTPVPSTLLLLGPGLAGLLAFRKKR